MPGGRYIPSVFVLRIKISDLKDPCFVSQVASRLSFIPQGIVHPSMLLTVSIILSFCEKRMYLFIFCYYSKIPEAGYFAKKRGLT